MPVKHVWLATKSVWMRLEDLPTGESANRLGAARADNHGGYGRSISRLPKSDFCSRTGIQNMRGRQGIALPLEGTTEQYEPPYKGGSWWGLYVTPYRVSDGEVQGGSSLGNSAVEVVPTPKENIALLPYFWKMGILNRFRPCNLAALRFPQKGGCLPVVRITRVRPGHDMSENKTGFPSGKRVIIF